MTTANHNTYHIQIISSWPILSDDIAIDFPCSVLSDETDSSWPLNKPLEKTAIRLTIATLTEQVKAHLREIKSEYHIDSVSVLCSKCMEHLDLEEEGQGEHQCVMRFCECENRIWSRDLRVTHCLNCIMRLAGSYRQ